MKKILCGEGFFADHLRNNGSIKKLAEWMTRKGIVGLKFVVFGCYKYGFFYCYMYLIFATVKEVQASVTEIGGI